MIADRIRFLRESNDYTQSALAKKLGITRASVNAWEMGVSTPSVQCIKQLTRIFHVSSDYLLEIDSPSPIQLEGLSPDDINAVYQLAKYLRDKNQKAKDESAAKGSR